MVKEVVGVLLLTPLMLISKLKSCVRSIWFSEAVWVSNRCGFNKRVDTDVQPSKHITNLQLNQTGYPTNYLDSVSQLSSCPSLSRMSRALPQRSDDTAVASDSAWTVHRQQIQSSVPDHLGYVAFNNAEMLPYGKSFFSRQNDLANSQLPLRPPFTATLRPKPDASSSVANLNTSTHPTARLFQPLCTDAPTSLAPLSSCVSPALTLEGLLERSRAGSCSPECHSVRPTAQLPPTEIAALWFSNPSSGLIPRFQDKAMAMMPNSTNDTVSMCGVTSSNLSLANPPASVNDTEQGMPVQRSSVFSTTSASPQEAFCGCSTSELLSRKHAGSHSSLIPQLEDFSTAENASIDEYLKRLTGPVKLFVNRIPTWMSNADLRKFFAEFGVIRSCRILENKGDLEMKKGNSQYTNNAKSTKSTFII